MWLNTAYVCKFYFTTLQSGKRIWNTSFQIQTFGCQPIFAEEICDILVSYDKFSSFYTLLKSREMKQKPNAATLSRFWLHITSACVVYADPAD